jgi:serine/threonine-protein kinase
MTQTGFVLGTPAYMSPEQAAGNPDDISPASDIWSMGVVWYECLTGEMPFEGASPTATLIAIANGRYHHLRRRMPDLPLAIAHAVDKALAKDPARRHADMDAFIQSLQRGLENPEERAAVTEPPPSVLQNPETPREHWSFGPPRAFATQTTTERAVALTGETEASQRTPPSIILSTPSPVRRWGLLAGVLGAVVLAGMAAVMITTDGDMPASRSRPTPRPALARPPATTTPPPPTPTATSDASTAAPAVTPAPEPMPAPESESRASHRARHGRDHHDETSATEPVPATPPAPPPCAVNPPRPPAAAETPAPETPTPAPAPRPSSPHEPITTYESTP